MTNMESAPMHETLQVFHQELLQLCDTLEIIADGLPDECSDQTLLTISRSIYPLVCRVHEFEEVEVFPYLVRLEGVPKRLTESLERLQFEHWEDESFAEELSENLRLYVTDPDGRNTPALAYMLRGFFEGLRRHIAFEADHLVPLLQPMPPLSQPAS